MGKFSSTVIELAGTLFAKRQAQQQGGLLEGEDPTDYNSSDPMRLWIIQLSIIIATSQLLAMAFRKLRQPTVIAEVIGGIVLGPTLFGRIPGFTQHIFPQSSRPYLTLTADIGLVLFLFLVGLEIDSSVIKRNARYAVSIAFAGMLLPFSLGAALSIPLYHHFISPSTKFTHFMLFTGVAYTITAFPVLCRILTELKLLDNKIGVIVLSAGMVDDIVGWVLLALSVALVNATSPLSAVWILLVTVGWALTLLFPIKRIWLWLAYRTGSIENGPTKVYMTLTMLLVFASAFFTDIIGVNAIFGGFLAGLVVPRQGGLAIALVEKLEDMVTIIFLPLYFTLSGLSTNLGLLDNGITWGFTIAIISVSYCGKFGGCTTAAKLSGFTWRESTTIGTLMSCKGLVELIVLNVGLSANILNPRVFSMFVLEAVTLTFMTTPVVTMIYPPARKAAAVVLGGKGAKGYHTEARGTGGADGARLPQGDDASWKTRFTVVLDKIEHVPGMMALTHLIKPSPQLLSEKDRDRITNAVTPPTEDTNSAIKAPTADSPDSLTYDFNKSGVAGVSIDALRLIELSDRTSAMMKSSVAETLQQTDPLLSVFRTYGELNNLPVSTSLSVVSYDNLAAKVAEHARENMSQLVLVPWLPPFVALSETSEQPAIPRAPSSSFDALFKSSTPMDGSASAVHAQFIRRVFAECSTVADVALFVDRAHHGHSSAGMSYGARQHILLPFFGGPDDRLALEFVVQLCSNPRISATIVKVRKTDAGSRDTDIDRPVATHLINEKDSIHYTNEMTGFPDTIYGAATTTTRLQSETADNIVWSRYALSPAKGSSRSPLVTEALSRIEFADLSSMTPLHALLQQTRVQFDRALNSQKKLLIVVGRSRRLAVESHQQELKELMDEYGAIGHEVVKTIGDVGTAFVVSGCNAGLVVVQSATSHTEN